MSMQGPDTNDAELILKLYDLRREPVMRASREEINGKFWPKRYEEFVAITERTHPMNRAYRQVSTYWEMAYSFARHGIVNAEFMAEVAGEGLLLYSKVQPYIERYRKEINSPTSYRNAEWLAKNSDLAAARVALFQERAEKMVAGR